MKKEYIVRGYLLSQHILPFVKIAMETKELAIALAEVLLEDKFHYVTIINETDEDDEILSFHKDLEMKAAS